MINCFKSHELLDPDISYRRKVPSPTESLVELPEVLQRVTGEQRSHTTEPSLALNPQTRIPPTADTFCSFSN